MSKDGWAAIIMIVVGTALVVTVGVWYEQIVGFGLAALTMALTVLAWVWMPLLIIVGILLGIHFVQTVIAGAVERGIRNSQK